MFENAVSIFMGLRDKFTGPAKNISGAVTDMHKKIAGLGDEMKKFDSLNAAAGKMQSTGASLMAMGGIIGGLTLAPALDAGKFQKSLNELAAMAGKTADDVSGAFSDEIIKLSIDTGINRDDIVKSLRSSLEKGLDLSSAKKIVEAQAKAAVAGGTNIIKTMDMGAQIAQAYNMPLMDAAKMNDILFASLQKGGATFEGVAGQLGKVVAPAARVGVSLENLQASALQLRQSGLSIEESYKGVSSAIEQLAMPSQDAAALFRSLGVQINANALKEGDLIGTMGLLKEGLSGLSIQAQNVAIGQIFKGSEAQKFAKDFMANTDAYKDFNKQLKGSSGFAAKAFKDARAGTEDTFEDLANTINNLKVSLGIAVLPVFSSLVKGIKAVVTPLISFIAAHRTFMTVVLGVITVISALIFIIGSMSFAIGTAIKMYTNLRMAIPIIKAISMGMLGAAKSALSFGVALMANPIGLIITGVVALVAVLVVLQKKFNIFGKLFDGIKSVFSGVMSYVQSFFQQFREAPLKAISGLVKDIIMANPLVKAFKAISGGLRSMLGDFSLWDFGAKLIDGFIDGIKSKFTAITGIVDKVKDFFGFGGDDEKDKGGSPAASSSGGLKSLPLPVAPQIQEMAGAASRSVDNSISIEFAPTYGGAAGDPAQAEQDARKLVELIRKEQARQQRLSYGGA